MGAVYEVLHKETKRKRALKLLLPVLVSDPDARERFAREATITADIDSENLVETFDAGIDPQSGSPFIVMELLRGESLGERLAQGRRLSAPQVVEILRQVARVLEKTHAAGIIHRDLKPDNLFVTLREDGTARVKVLDFGIAKIAEQASKSRNTINIGTPLYMAPEQLDGGKLGSTADVYSLGHVAYELLTGESYWESELRRAPSTLVLLKWMEGPMPEPASVRAARAGVVVGPAFDTWFARATARRPEIRYQRATDLVEGFVAALGLGVAALSMAAPLSIPRLSFDALSDTTTEKQPIGDFDFQERAVETDAPTRVRLPPEDRAPVSAPSAVPHSAKAARTVPAALIAVSGAAAVLALGALGLAVGGRGGRAVTSAQPVVVAVPVPTAPSAAASPVEVEPTTPTAAETAAPTASATAKPSAKVAPQKLPRADDLCKRQPERCR